MRILYRFFVLLIIILAFQPSWATHIVGGEINYRCLGNDLFEIEMIVYRDCINGVPYFDDPASVGVFNENNDLLYEVRIPVTNDDTLDANLDDPCFVDPPLACVHRSNYLDTLSLPFLTGGYQIAYQRCCRNGTIQNIVEPDSTGITYYSYINEDALLGCNNSAVFKQWPPVYICAGLPIVFDHSSIDADGDSIAYKMCAPFDGAMSWGAYNCVPQPCGVRPQPPFSPPYDSVQWRSPYYTENMLGGIPLSIDVNTGLLTGTPFTLGQFVVGICAEEYRNGQLISTTKRDFQYNIGSCQLLITSAFFAPEVQCGEDLNVLFQNQSAGSNVYDWDFGDGFTSNQSNPTHTFADTGSYLVTLITGPGQLCSDTFQQEINVQYLSLDVDFTLEYDNCADSITINYIDTSVDTISTITDWIWDFGNGMISDMQSPSVTYDEPGTYTINLTVESENGCVGDHSETIDFGLPQLSLEDTLIYCLGSAPINLNPNPDNSLFYNWTPSEGLDNPNSPNPTASPTMTTTYTTFASTFNNFDTCTVEQSVTVFVPPLVEVIARPDTIICAQSVLLSASHTNGNGYYNWSDSPDFSNIINVNGEDTVSVIPANSSTYYVQMMDQYGCEAVDEVTIERNLSLDVDFSLDYDHCVDSLTINFIDASVDTSSTITSWIWDFGNGIVSNMQSPSVTYYESGTYTVNLMIESENGCVGTHSETIDFNLPQLFLADTLTYCLGTSPISLNPSADNSLSYEWTPSDGLDDPNSPNPMASPTMTTTYTTFASTINNFDTCTVEQSITVFVPPLVEVIARTDTTICGQSVLLSANHVNGDGYYYWSDNPDFSNIINLDGSDTVTVNLTNSTTYYVQMIDQYGCEAVDEVNITSRAVDIETIGNEQVCLGDTLSLQVINLNPTDPLVYQWEPASEILSGANTATPLVSPLAPMTFTVAVENQFGCTATETVFVDVSSVMPPLSVYADKDSIFLGESVQLHGTIDPNYTYNWIPSETLNFNDIAEPIATPTETTTYELYISDDFGCVNFDSVTIRLKRFICDEPYIFVPNAFTPNSDGTNDIFYVRANSVTDVHLAVYSRWGELMFETRDLNYGWDGTYKGKVLSPDVYAYYLTLRCLNGEEYFKKGNVTLIR